MASSPSRKPESALPTASMKRSLATKSFHNKNDELLPILNHLFTIASSYGPAFVGVRRMTDDHFELKLSATEFEMAGVRVTAESSSLPVPNDCTLFTLDLTKATSAVVGIRSSQGKLNSLQLSAIASSFELARQAAEILEIKIENRAQSRQIESLRNDLHEAQHFYQRFSTVVHQCFWVLDTERGQVLTVSDNFEKVWGCDSSLLADGLSGFMSSVFPGDRDRVLADFHNGLEKDLSIEFRVIGPRSEIRWIWLRGFSLSPTQIVLIADDISEKKTEEELTRKRETELVAHARMQAIGDLASGVAHEINNPLTIIVGKAAEIERLLRDADVDRLTIAANADKIKRTSVRISEIVQSLKSLSRPERFNDRKLQRHPFSRIFQELGDFCKERFQAHGVELILAEAPPALCAEMNPTLVTQLLLNLLNNGHDAALSENEKWVRLDWTEDDDSIYLFVTDSGSGIPIKNRSRIFDPFFTTKDPGQGTGLGLSLASSIATHHRGALSLDTLHSHTRFTFQIPKGQGMGGK